MWTIKPKIKKIPAETAEKVRFLLTDSFILMEKNFFSRYREIFYGYRAKAVNGGIMYPAATCVNGTYILNPG